MTATAFALDVVVAPRSAALPEEPPMPEGLTYAASGVSIEAQDRAQALFSEAVRATYNDSIVRGLSDFGGMLALGKGFEDPVLVAGTDSVGTKLLVAFAMGRHDTIGQDAVAMCVDDIVCQGARPLFFLDCVSSGVRDAEQTAAIVRGVAGACRQVGCVLLGGEMAELPGLFRAGEYDLVGFAVGVVERSQIIDGSLVAGGDVLLGLASDGLHSNGYSLARKALLEVGALDLQAFVPELGCSLGEEMLRPTHLYSPAIVATLDAGLRPHALAHITGGGLPDNVARCIPEGLCATIRQDSFPVPPIFGLIQRTGNVADDEMRHTFNMGIGMVAVCGAQEAEAFKAKLEAEGEAVYVIGQVERGETRVRLA